MQPTVPLQGCSRWWVSSTRVTGPDTPCFLADSIHADQPCFRIPAVSHRCVGGDLLNRCVFPGRNRGSGFGRFVHGSCSAEIRPNCGRAVVGLGPVGDLLWASARSGRARANQHRESAAVPGSEAGTGIGAGMAGGAGPEFRCGNGPDGSGVLFRVIVSPGAVPTRLQGRPGRSAAADAYPRRPEWGGRVEDLPAAGITEIPDFCRRMALPSGQGFGENGGGSCTAASGAPAPVG